VAGRRQTDQRAQQPVMYINNCKHRGQTRFISFDDFHEYMTSAYSVTSLPTIIQQICKDSVHLSGYVCTKLLTADHNDNYY
jgi:hypothetical protein